MKTRVDLTGKQFGLLTVLEYAETKNNMIYWRCKCACGNEKNIAGKSLKNGSTKSCGCQSYQNGFNEIGKQYGHLLVLKRNETDLNNRPAWVCKCDCGNTVVVRGGDLRSGNTRSCGCQKSSYGEQNIITFLNNHNINYIQEYTFNDLKTKINGTPRFDFAIFNKNNDLQFLIEYQGKQHFNATTFGELQRTETDELKLNYCKAHNIELKYITYTDNIEQKLNEFFNF